MAENDHLLRAWTSLRLVHSIVGGAIARELEDAGFGAADGLALSRLAASPDGRLRMGDLATALALAQSGATRVIDRLVDCGWVTREQPPDNRRTTYAALTADGRAAFKRFMPIYTRAVHRHFASALSPSEVAQLGGLLETVVKHQGGLRGTPTPSAARGQALVQGRDPRRAPSVPRTSPRHVKELEA